MSVIYSYVIHVISHCVNKQFVIKRYKRKISIKPYPTVMVTTAQVQLLFLRLLNCSEMYK
jgi:hypothetical protein